MKLNESHYLTGMRQLKTSSQLFRDTRFSCCSLIEWTFMRQFRAIRAKLFAFILQICLTNIARHSNDSCETFMSVLRHSHEYRLVSHVDRREFVAL